MQRGVAFISQQIVQALSFTASESHLELRLTSTNHHAWWFQIIFIAMGPTVLAQCFGLKLWVLSTLNIYRTEIVIYEMM